MAAPGRHQSEGVTCRRHTTHVRVCRRAVKPHERAHASLVMYPHRLCDVGGASSSPSTSELYVPARSPPLHESLCARQLHMSRAKYRTACRPDRLFRRCSHASPSVLPQNTSHRRDVELTSSWRAERRGHHHGRLQSQRSGRSRATARAAARAVAVVMARTCACGACGACGSCGKAPHKGLCVYVGGWNCAGAVSGAKTAHAAFWGRLETHWGGVSTHVTII